MTEKPDDARKADRTAVVVPCRCTLVDRQTTAKAATFTGVVRDTTFAGCRIESKDFPREYLPQTGRGELLIDCTVDINGTSVTVQGVQRWANERQLVTLGVEFVKSGQTDRVASLHHLVHQNQTHKQRWLWAGALLLAAGLGWWGSSQTTSKAAPPAVSAAKDVKAKTPSVLHTQASAGPPSAQIAPPGEPNDDAANDHARPPPSPTPPVFFTMANVEQKPGEFSAVFKTNRPRSDGIKFRITDQSGAVIDSCRFTSDGPDVMASCRLNDGQQVGGILPYE